MRGSQSHSRIETGEHTTHLRPQSSRSAHGLFPEIYLSRVFPRNDCRLSRECQVIFIQAGLPLRSDRMTRSKDRARRVLFLYANPIYGGFARRNRKRDRYTALHFPETLIKPLDYDIEAIRNFVLYSILSI